MIFTNDNINADERQPSSFNFVNNQQKFIRIGTQNIRGFNDVSKQDTFFHEYFNTFNLDIIELIETKIHKNNEKFLQNNKKIFNEQDLQSYTIKENKNII
jgi:hypothetical protein